MHKINNNDTRAGFTIVELLIVIVVIGILAAITIVSFNGVTARSTFAKEKSEMALINKAIAMYYSENSNYPSTGGSGSWSGFGQAPSFVPGIAPAYISKIPQMPTSSSANNSYLYTSNGTDYKLIRYSDSTSGLPSVQLTHSLTDPARSGQLGGAWGYWSSGATAW